MSDLMVSEATLRINGLARQMRRWKMCDLIKRLRKHREYQKGNSIPCDWHPLICTEAADEIERLKANRADYTWDRANWAALQEAQRQIKQLEGDLQVTRLQRDARMVSEFVVDDAVKAEIERLEADAENLRNTITSTHLSLKERDAEIERLRKQKQIAVDALFSICESDWGISHSLAKPAHKAIEKLTAVEVDDERLRATR